MKVLAYVGFRGRKVDDLASIASTLTITLHVTALACTEQLTLRAIREGLQDAKGLKGLPTRKCARFRTVKLFGSLLNRVSDTGFSIVVTC